MLTTHVSQIIDREAVLATMLPNTRAFYRALYRALPLAEAEDRLKDYLNRKLLIADDFFVLQLQMQGAIRLDR